MFTGRGRLMERPQKPYLDLFDEKGISYEQAAGVLTVRGTLTPGSTGWRATSRASFFTGLFRAAAARRRLDAGIDHAARRAATMSP